MKIGKEEIIALVVALVLAVRMDQTADIAGWNDRARWLAGELAGVPGVVARYAMNNGGYADVDLEWDQSVIPIQPREFKRILREGTPSIVYDGTTVRTRQLRPGEDRLVADRLKALFAELRV